MSTPTQFISTLMSSLGLQQGNVTRKLEGHSFAFIQENTNVFLIYYEKKSPVRGFQRPIFAIIYNILRFFMFSFSKSLVLPITMSLWLIAYLLMPTYLCLPIRFSQFFLISRFQVSSTLNDLDSFLKRIEPGIEAITGEERDIASFMRLMRVFNEVLFSFTRKRNLSFWT